MQSICNTDYKKTQWGRGTNESIVYNKIYEDIGNFKGSNYKRKEKQHIEIECTVSFKLLVSFLNYADE